MGCLNSEGQFSHWFGNIHLSGPCNRSCYFCIGQHMMALDSLNNLDAWPLVGLPTFIYECHLRGITEVNLTGTNTDPMLYTKTAELHDYLRGTIPSLIFGVRTNGVAVLDHLERWTGFNKASITICSLTPGVYEAMMGRGKPPNLAKIMAVSDSKDIKINVVLGPENVKTYDLFHTLDRLAELGIKRVNLREPYGQPHVGVPFKYKATEHRLGMPLYRWNGMEVLYWDVHYVEVESVNFYANGRVSVDYPITRGHDPTGEVKDQSHFPGGRVRAQWVHAISPSTEPPA